MKNKGFTLIEIIITIALVAAISVTVGLSMSGMMKRQKEKELNAYQENIEAAACTYAETNNITGDYEVSIGTLLNSGNLKKDIKNPCTNELISKYNSNTIKIKWQNYEKICEYELTEEEKCK